MAKIRISKADKEEYRRLVKNTKAKIRRTVSKYGLDLSSEIDIPDLEDFTSREQFNKFKSEQKSFTNIGNLKYQFKKNKYDVVADKSTLLGIELGTSRLQRKARETIKRVEDKPFISGGKAQGTVGQRLAQVKRPSKHGVNVRADFDFDKVPDKQYLEKLDVDIKEKLDPDYDTGRKLLMKHNFMYVVEQSFNSKADELYKLLDDLPADIFYDFYFQFDEFDFDLYDSDGQNVDADQGTLDQMIAYLEDYYEGNHYSDLLSF